MFNKIKPYKKIIFITNTDITKDLLLKEISYEQKPYKS